jgi:hypothetical protein
VGPVKANGLYLEHMARAQTLSTTNLETSKLWM